MCHNTQVADMTLLRSLTCTKVVKYLFYLLILFNLLVNSYHKVYHIKLTDSVKYREGFCKGFSLSSVSNKHQTDKQIQQTVIDLQPTNRIKIGGERFIFPGDVVD